MGKKSINFYEVHPMNYYITVTIRCYKFQVGPKIKSCEDVSLKMPGASFFWGSSGQVLRTDFNFRSTQFDCKSTDR